MLVANAKVHVVGYPVGGDAVSVTEGVLSRVEVQAINSGRSQCEHQLCNSGRSQCEHQLCSREQPRQPENTTDSEHTFLI